VKRATPYQRIMAASRVGRGVHLSADDVFELALDAGQAVALRAELDDAADACRKRGFHRPDLSGTCRDCEGDAAGEK
jgi:hypothetical protein